jgi:hypothetical protein
VAEEVEHHLVAALKTEVPAEVEAVPVMRVVIHPQKVLMEALDHKQVVAELLKSEEMKVLDLQEQAETELHLV